MPWKFPECESRRRLAGGSYTPVVCLISGDEHYIYECGNLCRSGSCPKGLHEVKS